MQPIIVFFAASLLLPVFSVSHAIVKGELIQLNDTDGDGIVNTVDIDDDNDGIPDRYEIAANGSDIDSDQDGIPNRLDLDSDNDGIVDWIESGASLVIDLSSLRRVGGRLVGEVGNNGLLDILESPVDTGNLAYRIAHSDGGQDAIPDFLDLDSDNDGWPDLREAGVAERYDTDNNGRIDIDGSSVGNDGIADYLQLVNDQACCDLDGDGADDVMPLNTDLADLPDFQDLDSDNDGIYDIIELNGLDENNDGRVDEFRDVVGGADGMDDGVMAFPYQPADSNGNGVQDQIDTGDSIVTGDDSGRAATPVLEDGDLGGGVVLTGLNAAGCSITSVGSSNANHFWLLIMLLASARFFATRRADFLK